MEWIEWLLSRELRQFILDNNLFFPLLFVARLIGVTALELVVPARAVSYRSLLWLDIIGTIILFYVAIPTASFLSSFLAVRPVVPESILTLPTAGVFILYYVIGDFGAYWMHRFWISILYGAFTSGTYLYQSVLACWLPDFNPSTHAAKFALDVCLRSALAWLLCGCIWP